MMADPWRQWWSGALSAACLVPLVAQGGDAERQHFLGVAQATCAAEEPAEKPVTRGRLPLGGGHFVGYGDVQLENGDMFRAFDPDPRSGARLYELFRKTPRGLRAEISARFDSTCRAAEGREIRYAASGRAEAIEHLGAGLIRTGHSEELNPPVPAAVDPGGIRVALIDSGVNYLLPEVAHALARDSQGRMLGYDFREMDDRPFDVDPLKRGPFVPLRHGTSVASVLLAHGEGQISLIPYSFPGSDPRRFRLLVEDLRKKQVRIVNMSIGSSDPRGERHWREIGQVMASAPEILFVLAAGNEGRNLDPAAQVPAMFGLENVLVVGAVDGSGIVSRLSNYGSSVDVAVVADPIAGRDFDWQPKSLYGTSFAAPKIAALAARILRAEPVLTALDLKKRICAQATPVRGERKIACGYVGARL